MTLDAATSLSPLTKAMFIATSAIESQNKRVLLLSQNVANANIIVPPDEPVYQRKIPQFSFVWNPNVKTHLLHVKKILTDSKPPVREFDPSNPLAGPDGYTKKADISSIIEMTDIREAGRSHEAALRSFEKIIGMLQNTISLLKIKNGGKRSGNGVKMFNNYNMELSIIV